jgi:hypothetical protein
VSAQDNTELGQHPQELIVRQVTLFLKTSFTRLYSEFFPTQGPSDASIGVNIAPQYYLTNPYGGVPTMVAHPTEGGYTSLLLGLHQDTSAARRLQFDEVSNTTALD